MISVGTEKNIPYGNISHINGFPPDSNVVIRTIPGATITTVNNHHFKIYQLLKGRADMESKIVKNIENR